MMAVVSDILMTASLAILKIDDIINIIIGFISEGATYKTARLVCRQWQGICDRNHGYCVDRFSNHLLTLLKLYPDKNWDWCDVMFNKHTTVEWVKDNIHRDVSNYSHNNTFNPKIFEEISIADPIWNWHAISKSINITWDFI